MCKRLNSLVFKRNLFSITSPSKTYSGYTSIRLISTEESNNLDVALSDYHVPVLIKECCEYLNVKEGGLYVDCTLGGGGHTEAILKLGGRVIGLDQDPDAIKFTSSRLLPYVTNNRLEIIKSNFRSISDIIQNRSSFTKQDHSVDGVLMDLGISSYQIDQPYRGFSFGFDGPLDMRMNQIPSTKSGKTAEDIINQMNVEDLANILYRYGDETRSRQIAREICISRPLNTTKELADVINRITPFKARAKTLAKCFQAIRIYVNDEIGALKEALTAMHTVIKPNGRLVVLSYHSLEDRLVKNLFKFGDVDNEEDGGDNPWRVVNKKALFASDGEVSVNRRSRSAKLRAAQLIVSGSNNDEIPKTLSKYGSYVGKKQLLKMEERITEGKE